MRCLVLFSLLAVAGCSQPDSAQVPSGYVDEQLYADLQDRFDRLQKRYNARPELAELAEVKAQLAKVVRANEAYVAASNELAASAAPSKAPPDVRPSARERAAALESKIASTTNWSQLRGGADRTYGHTSGVRVSFSHINSHCERMSIEYDSEDELESNLAATMWLMIAGIGGDDEDTRMRNAGRIAEYVEEPSSIMVLEGGFVHISGVLGGKFEHAVYFTD